MTRSVAIVGAGAAGAGAAYALRDATIDVTVFEKCPGAGGRATTRRTRGCAYDPGANYVTNADERTAELLRGLNGDDDADDPDANDPDANYLATVDGPVWTFDESGTVEPGDRDETKWTWREGIAALAERLLARTEATLVAETRIESIERTEDGWRLVDADERVSDPFDALLLTPPAPETAALLSATKWHDERLHPLREAVGAVPYRTIRSVILHYPFEQERPYYALVNTDKAHEIGWLAREECKPGRVPDGESLLVVQMSPEWSEAHFDDPRSEIVPGVAETVADLVGDDRLREPDWTDDAGWRHALPDAAAARELIRSGESAGLYFAGDWVVGKGRVHEALWNGIETAGRIDGGL
jgi:predicted NAD/FAD-dependent oxidoreductase